MRVLGLDFETTGLDTAKDRITEMGYVLWDVESKRPLTTIGVFCHDSSYPSLSDEIVKLTGITDDMLKEFGTDIGDNLDFLDRFCTEHRVDYLVAHNAENFDKPLLMSELARSGIQTRSLRTLPWIDTRTDIPFAKEPDSRRLHHLALDCGFINPFAHRAIFDVLTMLRILSNYDISAVLEYQRIPFATCRAVVSYADKDKAKALRFSWEKIGEQVWPKQWVKRIKLNLLDDEIAKGKQAGFDIICLD